MSLAARFTIAGIASRITAFADERKRNVFLGMSWYGEKFINEARPGGTFKDRTGNLRSSEGYTIVETGKTKKIKAPTANKDTGGKGKAAARNFSREYAQTANNDGFILVLFAGMEYAAAVESRGLDVISPFIPNEREFQKTIQEWGDL